MLSLRSYSSVTPSGRHYDTQVEAVQVGVSQHAPIWSKCKLRENLLSMIPEPVHADTRLFCKLKSLVGEIRRSEGVSSSSPEAHTMNFNSM